MLSRLRFILTGLLFCLLSLSFVQEAAAQCVRVRDPRQGNLATFRPLKQFRCIATGQPDSSNFTITFASPASNFMVDWGDGLPPQLVAGPVTTLTHRVGRGIFHYRVWFSGCTTDTVKGDYVNDRNTTVPGIGFITPPAGYTNKRCVPEDLTIVNNSPGMNGFTEFRIYWGDLSIDTVDYNSFGQAITHTYQPSTTGCQVKISVIYQNLCGQIPGGLAPTAVYGDYFFMDRDSARVNPATILLCAPTNVTINDVSKLNCLDSTNRQIRWEGVQGFANPLPFPGNGIWRSYNGAGTRVMNIPTAAFFPIPFDSTYRVKMSILNQCGPDSAYTTIRIVSPRKPVFAVVNNNTCPGATMNFTNTTPNPGGQQSYFWEWGDGNTETNNGGTVGHAYMVGGFYWVKLHSIVNGYGGQVCEKVDSIRVQVQKTVTPVVNVNPKFACDSLRVRVENRSLNMSTVVWGGWEIGQSPTITAGSSYIPTIPGSFPSTAQVISTNPADSSAVILYKQYGRYIVRLKASSTGCPQITDADTIYIYQSPKIRWRLSDTRVCVGQSMSVRDSSRVIPTSSRNLLAGWNHIIWSLDFGDGTVINSPSNLTNNFDNPGASGRISFHTYASPGVYTVKLRVRTPYGCAVVDSQRVTVQPVAVPQFSYTQDVCDPTKVTIRNSSSLAAAKYEFSFSRGPVLYTRIIRAVRDTFTVTLPWVGPGDTTYYTTVLRAVTGVPGDTCSNATAPILIKVRPAPVALFSVSTPDGCTPLTGVQFFNNSYNLPATGGFNILWNFGNGNTFSGDNPPLQNYINSGTTNRRDTAKLTLVSPSGCRFTYSRPIITYPAPNAVIVAPDTVCHNASVTFSATGNGLANYLWRFTDLDGTTSVSPLPTKVLPNFGTSPVSYTVTLDVQTSSGCSTSVSKVITVMPLPVAGFSANPEDLCGNSTTPVDFNAIPGSTNAKYFFWSFGDASAAPDSTLSHVLHAYPANAGVTNLTYTASLRVRSALGCVSLPYTRTITVRPGVRAIFTPDTNKVCAPGTVSFANIGYRTGVDYNWFVRTLSGTGLGAAFTPNLGSGSFRYTFTNPSNLPVQQYVVTLVASAAGGFTSCADTLRDTITVYGVPQAAITVVSQNPVSGCSPLAIAARPDTSVAGSTYTWSFGDGSANVTANGPAPQSHTYTNLTNAERPYTLGLTVTTPFGCQALTSTDIRVKPVPTAGFSISDSVGCSPVTVRITNTSSAAADNFVWLVNGVPYNFDRNPTPFSFASTSATDTTKYVIRLVARGVGNACMDTSAPRTINVLPKPVVVLTPNPVAGCSPLTVVLGTAGSAGIGQAIYQRRLTGTLAWTAFDTTNGAGSQTTLVNNGSADQAWQIRMLATGTSGCRDSAQVSVTVSPSIQAALEALPDTVGCAPFTVTLRNRTTSAAANAFVWRINGQQVSASPSELQYRFDNLSATRDTVYVVELTASNQNSGCPSTATIRIRVKPTPIINFDMALTPPSACSPVQVRYSYVGNQGATRYTWLFAANDTLRTTQDTAIIRNYSNTGLVPAVRPIRLTAQNAFGCAATVQKDLTINPLVRAAFRQTASLGCAPLTVSFTSESTVGADVLEWIVDGVTRSNAQTFTYTFVNTGLVPVSFRVQLAARNSIAGACADTAATTITVNPTPRLTGLDVQPNQGCSPLSTTLTASATGATTYNWDFADGTRFDSVAATVGHEFVNFSATGNRVYNPRVIALNSYGCADSATQSVTVRPGSSAVIRLADSVGCSPLRVQLIGSGSINANVYTWDFGDGTPQATSANPVHIYTNADDTVRTFTIRLIAQRAGGFCPDTAYRTVQVNPLPLVRATPGDTVGCQPLAVRYRSTLIGADSSRWVFTSVDGTTIYHNRGTVDTVFTNLNPALSSVQVRLEGFNRYGCSAAQTNTTQVGPLAVAQYSQSADSGCSPLRVRFTGASTPGVVATWLVNGRVVGNQASGLNYTFANTGTTDTSYRIQLVVYNPQLPGCTDTAESRIVVFPRPNAGVLFASPNSGCSPLLVELNGAATGGVRYNWNLGDGTSFDTTSQTISHLFQNTSTTLNQTFNVRQIVFTQHGCADTARTSVLVRPLVRAGFTVSDSVGCGPLTVQFNAASSFNANSYTWDFGDGLGTATGRNPSYIFANTSDTVRRFVVRLTADKIGVGCPSTATQTIYVNPVPRAVLTPADTAGCQPFAVRLRSLSQAADSLAWTITSGSDVAYYPGRAQIDTVFTNAGSTIQTIATRLEAWNRYGCVNVATGRVRVSPFTQGGFTLNLDSACTPFRLIATSQASVGSTVQWFLNGTPVAATGNSLVATLQNPTERDSTVEVKQVTVNRLSPGCTDTVRKNIVIVARPRANQLTATPSAGCSPLTAVLQGSATGAVRYEWTIGNGNAFTDTAQRTTQVFVNNAASGTLTVRPMLVAVNYFGCRDTARTSMLVRPHVTAGATASVTEGCTPLRVQFGTSTSVNANQFSWNFGDGTTGSSSAAPVHSFVNDTDTVRHFTVILTADQNGVGCPDADTIVIIVNPKAIAAATPGDTAGCQPLRVRFASQSIRQDSLRWMIGSTATGFRLYAGQAVVDTVFGNGTADMQVLTATLLATNRYGCADSLTRTVRINPLVRAGMQPDVDSGCAPLRVQFANTSADGNLVQWFVNGTPVSQSATTFSYTFRNGSLRDSSYQMMLVATSRYSNACTDTVRKTIRVFGKPNRGVLFASPNTGCSPLLVELNGSATGGVRYNWNLGDGNSFDSTSQTISYLFQNTSLSTTQTFNVRQIVYNVHGCSDTATTRVAVRPLVRAAFTVSDTAGCAPLSVQFNAATSYNANTYTWDFGDSLGTATGRNPFYRFENTSDTVRHFTVTLVADKTGVGCPSTATHVITVYPVPRAAFTPSDTAGCQPFQVRLQSRSQAADSLAWTLTSGSDLAGFPGRSFIDTTFTNASASIQTISTRLEAWNRYGCVNVATGRVRVSPFTQAGFDLNQDSACTPFRLVANSLASPGSRVDWYINGTPQAVTGNALRATLYNFSDHDSTIQIMQVAVNRLSPGCTDTVRKTVVVVAKPKAGTLFASPDAGCSPLLVELNGNATGANAYNWNLGDGTVFDTASQTISHRFENLGSTLPRTFSIRMIATNSFGCADTARTLISVRPNVQAGIATAVRQGCGPLGVQLSSAPSVNANLFTWDFGDGTTGSNAAEPYHVFTNSTDTVVRYTVRLIADKAGIGCPDEDTLTITVFPRPIARFTPPDTMGCQPFALRFASQAVRADSLNWKFALDGVTRLYAGVSMVDTVFRNATADLQEHAVTLLAMNRFGCIDSVTQRVRVHPLVTAAFSASADSGCSPLPVVFANQSAEGNRVQWFVNGQLVSQNPSNLNYTFVNASLRDTSYQVMLVAYSRFGAQCADTVRKTIRVFGRPQAGVLFASPESGCSPLLVELNGAAQGAVRFTWNFNDGTSFDTTSQTVSHLFVNPQPSRDQVFAPYLVAINAHGCRDTARTEITVKPGVVAAFSVSDTAGCAPLGVLFSNGSRNANLYQWDFADGSGTSFQTNPYHVFENRSDTVQHFLVRLVSDKNGVGCPATAERMITVFPRPVAAFTPGDTSGCQPFSLRLQNQSRGASTWYWTLTGPSGSVRHDTLAGLDTTFVNMGSSVLSTQVTLSVTSAYGCTAERTQTLRTFPLVAAAFSQSADSGCAPLKVRFENQSAAGNRASWYIGGQYVGSSTSSFDYTFQNTTGRDSVVTVLLAVQHPNAPGCADTLRHTVTVFAKPVAGLLTPQPEAGCSPLVSMVVGSATGAVRYSFDFGDGTGKDTTVQSLPHTYVNTTPVLQTYLAQMIAISNHGCADTTTAPVRVRPEVVSRISLIDSAGCTPLTARFSGATSLNANRYEWDFGDGSAPSLGSNVQHIYRNADDTVRHFTIRLVADRQGNGCPDTSYNRVTVYPQPVASVAASATEGCSPFPVRLTDQSTTQGRRTMLIFTDGVQVDTVRLAGTTLDTVLVNNTSQRKTVWVEAVTETPFGCQDRRRIPLYVNPRITASFDRPAAACAPLKVNFRNTSNNPDDLYEWDFGDGSAPSSDKNPSHIFRYNGVGDTLYVVTLKSRSNAFYQPVCEAIYRDTVRVSGRPSGAFSFVPEGIVRLPDNQITIRNQTLYRNAWHYQWSFGDGTTDTTSAETFTHTLTGLFQELQTTQLTVTMIVSGTGGCPDTVRLPLTILPVKPEAAFKADTQGCAPVDVVFHNRSKWANAYEWNFGDGTGSTEANPIHRYSRPGVYTVRLIVRGPGGSDTATQEDIIHVYEVPSAAFTTFPKAPRKLMLPDDQLIGILRDPKPGESYLWDFGDGQTATDAEPKHLYNSPGSYIISLTVTSAEGCIARDTSSTPVEAEMGGYWLVPNAFSPNPNGSNGGRVDDNTPGSYNDVFYPFTEGVTEIDLQIFDRWGNAIFRSQQVGYGWDGYYKGALCQSDTYVFKITAKFITGQVKTKVGDVTLIR